MLQGGPGSSVSQARGGDGGDLGGRRRLVVGGWARLHLVPHRRHQLAAGSAHLRRGGLSTASVGGGQADVVFARLSVRGSQRAFLLVQRTTVVRRTEHFHHQRHGDPVLVPTAPRLTTRIPAFPLSCSTSDSGFG